MRHFISIDFMAASSGLTAAEALQLLRYGSGPAGLILAGWLYRDFLGDGLRSLLDGVRAGMWDRMMRRRGVPAADRTRVLLEKAYQAQGLPPPPRPTAEEEKRQLLPPADPDEPLPPTLAM